MNGFILLIPFLFIRFYLLSKQEGNAIKRAAYFAPMQGNEIIAYYIYQFSNVVIFVYLFFLSVTIKEIEMVTLGICLYILGLILCALSIINFASPSDDGLSTVGIYKYSRNPMYISYFVLFIGCSIMTNSVILFVVILIFQISVHWIILAEERWCIKSFGESYKEYMKTVRRYI